MALAHTSHLPPPAKAEQDQEQEGIELDPEPILSEFGFTALPLRLS